MNAKSHKKARKSAVKQSESSEDDKTVPTPSKQKGSAVKQSPRMADVSQDDETVTPSKPMRSKKKKEAPSPQQPTIYSHFQKTPDKKKKNREKDAH